MHYCNRGIMRNHFGSVPIYQALCKSMPWPEDVRFLHAFSKRIWSRSLSSRMYSDKAVLVKQASRTLRRCVCLCVLYYAWTPYLCLTRRFVRSAPNFQTLEIDRIGDSCQKLQNVCFSRKLATYGFEMKQRTESAAMQGDEHSTKQRTENASTQNYNH